MSGGNSDRSNREFSIATVGVLRSLREHVRDLEAVLYRTAL